MLCPSCLQDKGSSTVCGHCQFDESAGPAERCLPFRYELHNGAYVVGKILGSRGGFGVAYKALDTVNRSIVVVKEFHGRAFDYGTRKAGRASIHVNEEHAHDYRRSLNLFRREAKVLKKFKHPNIVRVIDVFDENGTSYYVMPFVDGTDLGQYIETRGGKLGEEEVLSIAKDTLSALVELRDAKTLHCDIKPSNILLTNRKKKAILIDFGAARRMLPWDDTLPAMYSKKYAPRELIRTDAQALGPWTDIYLLCATLYECLTGKSPPMDKDRRATAVDPYIPLGTLMPTVDARLSAFIDKGLALEAKDRPGDALKALRMLPNPPVAVAKLPVAPRRQAWLWWPLFGLAIVLGVFNRDPGSAIATMVFYAAAWVAWPWVKRKLQNNASVATAVELLIVGRDGTRTPLRKLQPNDHVTIGRSREADIRIANNHLSGLHVSIALSESGVFTLTDLKSLNGTHSQPPGIEAPPAQWPKVESATGEEGVFMLGHHRDGGIQLEIRRVPLSP